MLRFWLKRLAYLPNVTLGRLQLDDDLALYTVERPWLSNKPFVSCVPQGVYVCKRYSSAKYPNTFELQNVPERSKILFHVANTAQDVQGCIGLGTHLMTGGYGVANSRDAVARFQEHLRDVDQFELILTQFRPEYP